MRLLKRGFALVICAVMLLCCVACASGYKKARIYLNLPDIPKNLDPQTASSVSELMIVRNVYEGLLRRTHDGKIVCGVCESYEKNGLTYTFRIKENARYFDGTELFADDFVFAFTRAVSKNTGAPFVSRLFSVKNAKGIYEGTANPSSLGVEAVDKKTLKITLAKEDEYFESTLTSSICMPCNREFFEQSVGKYGLERKYLLPNGSYYISRWNTEDFGIRLFANAEYGGSFEAENDSVFLSVTKDGTPLSVLDDKSCDISFVGSDEVAKINKNVYTVKPFQNICWVLTVGSGYSAEVRQSFLMSADYSVMASSLNANYSEAGSIYPPSLNIENGGAQGVTGYNIGAAQNMFSNAVKDMSGQQFPAATLYYCDNGAVSDAVKDLVGHWQQNLCAFVNITAAKNENLLPELKNRTLDFAVFPVYSVSGDVRDYINLFTDNDTLSPADAQKNILADFGIKPLFYETTNIVCAKSVKQIFTDGYSGYIDFCYIHKDD